jgi:hypothetical protein
MESNLEEVLTEENCEFIDYLLQIIRYWGEEDIQNARERMLSQAENYPTFAPILELLLKLKDHYDYDYEQKNQCLMKTEE